jgi:hypothetical protein
MIFGDFFECFLTIDFDAFFDDFGSQRGSEIITNVFFSHFWGVRFRGCILEGILDDFCMRKPSKNIVKHSVCKLFRLFEKVVKSTRKLIQNMVGNQQNP